MRTLSDTIARLTAMRRSFGIDQNVPDRLSALDAFGSNPGSLRARIYIPATLRAKASLVVVLHGCTQSAAAYDHGSGWSDLADEHGFALLFPEQQRSNNPNLCFNWFLPADATRDKGEALSIRQMIDAMLEAYPLDPAKVFITGLSAGGAMASVMLATYPELFAGGGVIAGLAYGSANTIPEAFDRMRGHGGPASPELVSRVQDASAHDGPWPRISIWQGSADATVHPSNADAILDQWRGLHSVARKPSRTETVNGHIRHVWTDADGRTCIEQYSIAGMGHGTPLMTSGPEARGASGAYMLDAGISSTCHLASFFGVLDPAAPVRQRKKAAAQPKPVPAKPADQTRAEPRPDRAAHAGSAFPAAAGIQKTIEDALRSAGLMR